MSSEYQHPVPDPDKTQRRVPSESWGAWYEEQSEPPLSQFTYREHVSGSLAHSPADAPLFRPVQPPVPGNGVAYPPVPPPGYPPYAPPGVPYAPRPPQGYGYPTYPPPAGYPPYGMPHYPPGYQPYAYHPYPGYPGYPGYRVPEKPKRDGYLLGMNILTLVCGSLIVLGGLGIALITLLFLVAPRTPGITDDQYFSSMMTFIAFTCAGLIGGGFTLYHSIRSLVRKPSHAFALPMFWIFLILYGLVLAISFGLQTAGQQVSIPFVTVLLIAGAAIFPATTLLALAVRRLRIPRWATSWRRFAVALTSGATLGIFLALIFELGLMLLLPHRSTSSNLQVCIDNPNAPGCNTWTSFAETFVVVAVIAPLVEETVKPLAVAMFIGRVRNAAEAFILGMACGIGFDLIETVGYIGSGYRDWLYVALERTGAGLLHGFGAAMVTLGWYYLTHTKDSKRYLRAFLCWGYAVFQHFVWNGTATLALLPDPAGSTINSWVLSIGVVQLSFLEIANIIESILILIFFIYMTGRLRKHLLQHFSSRSDGTQRPVEERPQLTAHA